MAELYTTVKVGCDSGSGLMKKWYMSTTVSTPLPCGGTQLNVMVVLSRVSNSPATYNLVGVLGAVKKKIQNYS